MPEPMTPVSPVVPLGALRLGDRRAAGPEAPVASPAPQGDRFARSPGLGGIQGVLRGLNQQASSLPPAPPPPPLPAPPSPEAWAQVPPVPEVVPSPPAWRPRASLGPWEVEVTEPVRAPQGKPSGAPQPVDAVAPGQAPQGKPRPAAPKPKPELQPGALPPAAPVAGPAPMAPARPKPQRSPEQAPVRPVRPAPAPPSAPGREQGAARFAGLTGVGKALGPGATGATVLAVQEALGDMAFVIPAGPTGSYGPQTEQAVRNFQAFAGLPRSGKVDAATWQALQRLAPPPGLKAWEAGADPGPIPSPELGQGKRARVVVGIGQHRAFLFDKAGKLVKIYAVRTGREGLDTKPGVKVIDGKNDDPTEVSNRLWPDSGGRAFGDRLLGLSNYDLATGKKVRGSYGGQELHGTDQRASIGRNFSHGCVGLVNEDIHEIFNAVRVGELVRFDA